MNDNRQLMLALITKFHFGQLYGNEPYINHCIRVADRVAAVSNDERAVDVALGHDLLEDTNCTKELLYTLFEDNVVNAIIALSKIKGQSKEDYISVVKSNDLARLVKIHDTMENLTCSVQRNDTKRIVKYSQQLQELVK